MSRAKIQIAGATGLTEVGHFRPIEVFTRELLLLPPVRPWAMSGDDLNQLESECRRATDAFLALDWGHSKPRVRVAVAEMLSSSKLYTSSMAFLLKESTKLPVQAEPARHLIDLVNAISALQARKRQVEVFSREDSTRRDAVA